MNGEWNGQASARAPRLLFQRGPSSSQFASTSRFVVRDDTQKPGVSRHNIDQDHEDYSSPSSHTQARTIHLVDPFSSGIKDPIQDSDADLSPTATNRLSSRYISEDDGKPEHEHESGSRHHQHIPPRVLSAKRRRPSSPTLMNSRAKHAATTSIGTDLIASQSPGPFSPSLVHDADLGLTRESQEDGFTTLSNPHMFSNPTASVIREREELAEPKTTHHHRFNEPSSSKSARLFSQIRSAPQSSWAPRPNEPSSSKSARLFSQIRSASQSSSAPRPNEPSSSKSARLFSQIRSASQSSSASKPRFVLPTTSPESPAASKRASYLSKRDQTSNFAPGGMASELRSWIFELGSRNYGPTPGYNEHIPRNISADDGRYQLTSVVASVKHLSHFPPLSLPKSYLSPAGRPSRVTIIIPRQHKPMDGAKIQPLLLFNPPLILGPSITASPCRSRIIRNIEPGDCVGIKRGLLWEVPLSIPLIPTEDAIETCSRALETGPRTPEPIRPIEDGQSLNKHAHTWVIGADWDILDSMS
ncbi:hypothetical protein FQN57_001530 [Myotisia sp. PD_48]|nr:hypothetical protein FQN57_001530 [Myotisia sp. PD_48]